MQTKTPNSLHKKSQTSASIANKMHNLFASQEPIYDYPSLQLPTIKTMLSVREVAGKLRITPRHVVNLIDMGRLQGINLGCSARKMWRIPLEALKAFFKANHSHEVD